MLAVADRRRADFQAILSTLRPTVLRSFSAVEISFVGDAALDVALAACAASFWASCAWSISSSASSNATVSSFVFASVFVSAAAVLIFASTDRICVSSDETADAFADEDPLVEIPEMLMLSGTAARAPLLTFQIV